jgi:hypothetical protein
MAYMKQPEARSCDLLKGSPIAQRIQERREARLQTSLVEEQCDDTNLQETETISDNSDVTEDQITVTKIQVKRKSPVLFPRLAARLAKHP